MHIVEILGRIFISLIFLLSGYNKIFNYDNSYKLNNLNLDSLSEVINANLYMKYPSIGKRSWGGETRVCINEIPGRLEYSSWWNKKSVFWAQIESIKAVNNANLFAINGADILSWGPNDLAFNLEQNIKDPLKSDDDCINNVLTQLKDSNTKLCVRTYSDYDISKYNSMGVTLFLDETILVA